MPTSVPPATIPPAPDPPLRKATRVNATSPPSQPFRMAVNTVSGPSSTQAPEPALTIVSHPPTPPPRNTPDEPLANYDREWLQTSPPPDPSLPKPLRGTRHWQSQVQCTPTTQIQVQVYGYPPVPHYQQRYNSYAELSSDSDDDQGYYYYGDEASHSDYSDEICSVEYAAVGYNYDPDRNEW